ncbi:MAG: hypothetical protein U0929_04205 [Planctomycetaceae bacterium]
MNETSVISSGNSSDSKGICQKKPFSTCLKMRVLVLGLTICCGVGYYFFQQSMKLDPAQITAIQREIVDIDLPTNLHPGIGINRRMSFAKLKMALYNPTEATSLMLIGFLDNDEHDYEQSMKACHLHANEYWNNDFQVESSELKSIQINGTANDFQFIKGKIILPGGRMTPGRLIFGQFAAKNYRKGFIRYSITESDYDEEAVIQMLESIRK